MWVVPNMKNECDANIMLYRQSVTANDSVNVMVYVTVRIFDEWRINA